MTTFNYQILKAGLENLIETRQAYGLEEACLTLDFMYDKAVEPWFTKLHDLYEVLENACECEVYDENVEAEDWLEGANEIIEELMTECNMALA